MKQGRNVFNRTNSGKFVVDGSYVRDQAREAVKAFVAPYAFVFAETKTGTDRVGSRRDGSGPSVASLAASVLSQEKKGRRSDPKG